jgi:putative membrane protein
MLAMVDPAVAAALTEAVRELESRSCAEVVVEIRSRSGSYAHADARFASLVALLALVVLLFSPWTFQPVWVVIDVAIAWVIGLIAASKSDPLRRVMTTSRERTAQVHATASAAFHDRGVANTSGETGVLVFHSVMERRMELLADRGIIRSVPAEEWTQLVSAARAPGATTSTLLATVRALTPVLECHLPVQEGDVDELCNVPFVSE